MAVELERLKAEIARLQREHSQPRWFVPLHQPWWRRFRLWRLRRWWGNRPILRRVRWNIGFYRLRCDTRAWRLRLGWIEVAGPVVGRSMPVLLDVVPVIDDPGARPAIARMSADEKAET